MRCISAFDRELTQHEACLPTCAWCDAHTLIAAMRAALCGLSCPPHHVHITYMDARASCPRLPVLTLAVRVATSYSRILRHTNLNAYPIYIYIYIRSSSHLGTALSRAPMSSTQRPDSLKMMAAKLAWILFLSFCVARCERKLTQGTNSGVSLRKSKLELARSPRHHR